MATLVGIRVSGGNNQVPVATVDIRRGDEIASYEAEGDGMVNAAFVAIQDAFALPATLIDYRVSPLTAGADAMAQVSVIIQIGPETYSGSGVSTDVVEGSARAFVAAMNKRVGAVVATDDEA